MTAEDLLPCRCAMQPHHPDCPAAYRKAVADEIERLRGALSAIAERHMPDPPGSDAETHARQQYGELRRIAHRALDASS